MIAMDRPTIAPREKDGSAIWMPSQADTTAQQKRGQPSMTEGITHKAGLLNWKRRHKVRRTRKKLATLRDEVTPHTPFQISELRIGCEWGDTY